MEYGYGILLEESDRLIDEDYYLGLEKAQEAYQEFKDAKEIGISILKDSHKGFPKSFQDLKILSRITISDFLTFWHPRFSISTGFIRFSTWRHAMCVLSINVMLF